MKRNLFSLLPSRAAAQPRAVLPPARRSRAAQAYLESILVLLVLFLLLFGFLQAALLYGGRDVLHHAASRAARARAVGFNDWMAEKAARVAAIPVSGHLLAEDVGWEEEPGADMAAFELARIPGYLASENHARAQYVLDYEEWARGSLHVHASGSLFGGGVLHETVRFDAPLRMPLAGWFVPWARRDENGLPRIVLEAEAPAGEHSTLYLR